MIFTQEEVSTCGVSPMDYKGVYEDDSDGLEDEWDGF